MSPALLDVAVFHCQQTAEKALKAYLTWHDRPFRKTYRLSELVEQCMDIVGEFAVLLPAAEKLTPYAVDFRYPGEASEPAPGDAREALHLAKEIYDFVMARLPAETRPPKE